MILDLFNNENNTIETDTLSIKEHAIATQNDVIQIDNISMMTKATLAFRISLKEIVFVAIMLIMFPIDFIPNIIPITFLALYIYIVYNRYEKYLKTKYYIEFNLGSSKNSYLFFKEEIFRDKVYEVIKKSFGDKNQITFIDIKHQNIENYDSKNIYEKEVSQTTVSGNDNVVGNDFGSGNNVTFNGDNNVNSNIVTDSILEKSNMNVEFPWSELSKQLQQIVNNASVLSEQSVEILKDLLAATDKNSESEFNVIVKENASFFNQQFIKDIISGTLGGVISSLLSGR